MSRRKSASIGYVFFDATLYLPSRYSSAPDLKVLWMSSKACHMVGEIDLDANVQLSMISKTSL